MISFSSYELWFITGSQHLYGDDTLKQVDQHAKTIADYLNQSSQIPINIAIKPVLTTPEAILNICLEANSHAHCVGIISWMHTFSPAKMWIGGLKILHKPLLHFHTQFGQEIPWSRIDMDFMNLHQSAHGGREFGFINARMRKARKIIVGHWKEESVLEKIGQWGRVTCAWADSQQMKIARIGDNMRHVAVTEGDKVSAQIQFGYSVNGYGLGDVVAHISSISEQRVNALLDEYEATYQLSSELQRNSHKRLALVEAAKIELGLKSFLEEGGFHAFTDTFENLHGLDQLPGLAVQRLMNEGYGFGAEGDWKTAALVRTMKVMAHGLEGGNSFMEDYTYHFGADGMKVLGAHMLEICPSIAAGTPKCELHPLGIGGKADPVRLVFDTEEGDALNASVIDLGNRFRILANKVTALTPDHKLPKLPVARVLWDAMPDSQTAAHAWILAGGAHHTCFSQNLQAEQLEDFADIANVEFVLIDQQTDIYRFKQELRWNELYFILAN